MSFDEWIKEVRQLLSTSRPEIDTERLDPDAMYQAWRNNVSPRSFSSAPKLLYQPTEHNPQLVAPPSIVPPVTPPPTAAYHTPRPGVPTPEPFRAPISNLGTRKKKSDMAGIGIIMTVTLVVVAAVVLNLNKESNQIVSPVANPLTSESKAVNPPRPMTEAQKFDRARSTFASWKGSEAEFSSGIAMLKEIPRSSKKYSEASTLIARWVNRKKELDGRKEKERKLAEARRREAERVAAIESIKRERKEARYFTGEGDVKVAIGDVKLRRSTDSHIARGNSTFVYVLVSVLNEGPDTVHANPNDFTLADSRGNTVSHETDTYALSNYFDAVNLRAGQQTGGWLIFYLPKDHRYTLTRTGGFGGPDVTKTVIP